MSKYVRLTPEEKEKRKEFRKRFRKLKKIFERRYLSLKVEETLIMSHLLDLFS